MQAKMRKEAEFSPLSCLTSEAIPGANTAAWALPGFCKDTTSLLCLSLYLRMNTFEKHFSFREMKYLPAFH